MKKKLTAALLAVCISVSLLPATALADRQENDVPYAVEGGNIWFDKETGTVTDCDDRVTRVVIPEKIEGVTVRAIGSHAFSVNGYLVSVQIPNTVTEIQNWAFANTSLHEVIIPEGVTSIGEYAFSECVDLTYVSLPDTLKEIKIRAFQNSGLHEVIIPDSVTVIEQFAFASCSDLTYAKLPSGLTTIANSLFAGCTSLINIEIPDTVTSIEDNAFYLCSSLTGIEMPDSVTSVGDALFQSCGELKYIKLSDNIKSITDSMFRECKSLTDIRIPDGVTAIGNSAFEYCSALKGISIPSGVTTIEPGAFMGCISFTGAVIPDGVTILDYNVFGGCHNLTTVTIPDSAAVIVWDAFQGCNSLSDIYYAGSEREWNAMKIDSSGNGPLLKAQIHFNSPYTALPEEEEVLPEEEEVPPEEEVVPPEDEKVWTEEFNAEIYHAYWVYRDKDGVDFALSQETPSQSLKEKFEARGGGYAAEAWKSFQAFMDTSEDPTNLQSLNVEMKDVYSALILNALEASAESESALSMLEDSFGKADALISAVTNMLKENYGIELMGGETIQEIMERIEQKAPDANELMDSLDNWFKKNYPELAKVGSVSGWLAKGADFLKQGADFKEYVETCLAVNESCQTLENVLRAAYDESCSRYGTQGDMTLALKECLEVISASHEDLILRMINEGEAVAGKKAIKYWINELVWSEVNNLVTSTIPEVGILKAVYKVDKLVLDEVFKTSDACEQYVKMACIVNLEDLIDSVRRDMGEKYNSDPTGENAADFLNATRLSYRLRYADYDTATGFVDIYDGALANKVLDLFQSNNRGKAKEIINNVKGLMKQGEENMEIAWIEQLPIDYPGTGLYEKYSAEKALYKETGYKEPWKEFDADCPVNVSVFDGAGALVASVEDGRVSCGRDDVMIILNGDSKTVRFADGEGYRVEYTGYDTGTMDLTVRQSDANGEIVRTTSFFDVPVSASASYEFAPNGDAGEMTDQRTGAPVRCDYDSENVLRQHTVSVRGGAMLVDGDFSLSALLDEGKTVEIFAYVPDGYRFAGWDIFEEMETPLGALLYRTDAQIGDTLSPVTSIRVPDRSLTLSPFLVREVLPFNDIDYTAYYTPAVRWALEEKITTGTEDGTTFAPGKNVTRAEAVTFLWRAKGEPEPAGTDNPFTDVKEGEWYYKAVLWAVGEGITNGTSDTTFEPDTPVVRGSMITFLWRAMGRPGDSGITDPALWYVDAEKWAASRSLTVGTAVPYSTGGDCPRSDVVYYMWEVLGSEDQYEFVFSNCTWEEARKEAADRGGHLVCIDSAEEYEYLSDRLNSAGLESVYFRIGGRRDAGSGDYYWVDAQDVPYGSSLNGASAWCGSLWQEGEPNLSWGGTAEDRMEMVYAPEEGRWVWNDMPNVMIYPSEPERCGYIIEYDTGTLRLAQSEPLPTPQLFK